MTDVPAHSQTRRLIETIWYPEHAARHASPEYHRVHHHLVYELNEPCWVCGVRQTDLPKGQHMETHHWWVEWSLANAVDPKLVVKELNLPIHEMDATNAWLRQWLDSEGNMLVLCPAHHRHGLVGVHMTTYPAWVAQKFEATHDITKEQP